MKIYSSVYKQYTKLCPKSAAKSSNKEEVRHKIYRAITLGRVIDIREGGDTLIVRYYHNNFKIKNNKVVSMWIDNRIPSVEINEELKNKYDEQVGKTNLLTAW